MLISAIILRGGDILQIIVVLNQDARTRILAEQLGLQLVNKAQADAYLYYKNDCLTIHIIATGADFTIDFTAGKSDYRRRHAQKELLLRALGGAKLVCDLTAGFAADAFVMASNGITVDAVEQNPIIFALLIDAKARLQLKLPEIAERMRFYNCRAEDWLQKNAKHYAAIYLDPMFPERNKSAKVKKAAQVLQFLNKDLPASDWNTALHNCTQRLVVKRPKAAPNLLDMPESFVIKGKTCRFDVFLCKAGGASGSKSVSLTTFA